MVFGLKMKILTLAKNDFIGKSISRGAEWRKFQLPSTFQCGCMATRSFQSIRMVKIVSAGLIRVTTLYHTCTIASHTRQTGTLTDTHSTHLHWFHVEHFGNPSLYIKNKTTPINTPSRPRPLATPTCMMRKCGLLTLSCTERKRSWTLEGVALLPLMRYLLRPPITTCEGVGV